MENVEMRVRFHVILFSTLEYLDEFLDSTDIRSLFEQIPFSKIDAY